MMKKNVKVLYHIYYNDDIDEEMMRDLELSDYVSFREIPRAILGKYVRINNEKYDDASLENKDERL